jgi:hypothetical protein
VLGTKLGIETKIGWRRQPVRWLLIVFFVAVIGLGLVSCSQPGTPTLPGRPKTPSRLSEVAPPALIQELRKALDKYQPQVTIVSPRSDEVVQDTTVSVQLRVNDLRLFKDDTLGLGPHLHFILDNQPYEAIYDVSKPILLEDLTPGTHTIRVFASRPWHESFKNEGAYAQTTFHIFAKTPENNPQANQPLLTYSRPKGSYGAEPVMLDFYLTNAPLHLVAQEKADDDIHDWKIRCTVNGESFTFDRWEPIYLKGFKPGRNWVQLELLDEQGNSYANAFNNTVRLIDYQPGGTDALSKLTRGELDLTEAMYIVDSNYVPPAPEPEPQPELAPELEPEPELSLPAEPEVPVVPVPEVSPGEIPEVLPNEPTELSPTVPEVPAAEAPVLEAPGLEPFDETTLENPDRQPDLELTEPEEISASQPPASTAVKQALTEEVEEQLQDLQSSNLEERVDAAPTVPIVSTSRAPADLTDSASTAVVEKPPADDKLLKRARRFFDRLLPASEAEETGTPTNLAPLLEEISLPESPLETQADEFLPATLP